ncbi:MAG: AAA family ATPase [Catenibacterium mitsuokai]|nr:AAA family ATPase [Catenibacterium mitsuokai]MBN2931494.1 AAA family ATPase [Catenibacterium mitsuokai]
MELDLSGIDLFDADNIIFDKRKTYIYGPNGTGKTTISNQIKKMSNDYDVYVFQGFESVISSDKTLNAIVLGTENVEISQRLDKINVLIENKQKEIDDIKETISEPENQNQQNYWTKKNDAEEQYNQELSNLQRLYRESASFIKKLNRPQVAQTSYNKNNFENDILSAKYMSKTEIELAESTINTEIKMLGDVTFPNYDMQEMLLKVKRIIEENIQEPVKLDRIDNSQKRKFVKLGYDLHHKGDICSFCGNKINDKVFDELDNYFSESNISDYQKKINEMIEEINQIKTNISLFNINGEAYPDYSEELTRIKNQLQGIKKANIDFLNELQNNLDYKCKHLFESLESITLELPEDFKVIKNDYIELREKNNSIDLPNKQKEAKNSLRLHYVKQKLEEIQYDRHMGKLEKLGEQKDKSIIDFEQQCRRISEGSPLQIELLELKKSYKELQSQTLSETKLVDIINSKLRTMVSFELNHATDESNHGIYNIKDTSSGQVRDITKLSTGEKNIIAFLYFIEKIHSFNPDDIVKKDKIVVFDDPMCSNDDGMQYLIMEELNKLIKKDINGNDRFILLTHNKHFYINTKYNIDYKKDCAIHFQSINGKTVIQKIDKKEKDFKTSYDALWDELKVLYNYDQAKAELLLNPIRRIIETYTNFNAVSLTKFYNKVSGAKKLFDVNSHSIDDLQAELNGKTKQEILDLFKQCFYLNNAKDHFDTHWNAN